MSFGAKKAVFFSALILFLAGFPLLFRACVKDGDVSIQQGSELFQKKKFSEAAAFFERSLSQEKSYTDDFVFILIANCHSQSGDYDGAIEWRKKALDICEDAQNYIDLGLLYRLKKDEDAAEKSYKRAAALDQNSVAAAASLASMYLSQRREKEALPLFLRAVESEPDSGILHADLAICHARLGDFESAQIEYEKAKRLKLKNIGEFKKELDEIMKKKGASDR